MASMKWTNLPPDILAIIAKLLESDIDILRLRSICSSWRSSVPPRLKPSLFPLEVPSPYPPCSSGVRCKNGHYFLNYTTVYRLSPPEFGLHPGDTYDGWLFRVLEVNPNRFSFLSPYCSNPSFIELPSETIPDKMNLLDHRISEICKAYNLSFVDSKGISSDALYVKKVVVIRNYSEDCDFVVFLLFWDFVLIYWKFGDKCWTLIDTERYYLNDMVVCEGKLYAIGKAGVLISIDSKFNLAIVPFPPLPVSCYDSDNYLVEYNSNLYALYTSKTFKHTNNEDDSSDEEDYSIQLELRVFKKCDEWMHVTSLGDVVFLSCEDYSFGLSTEYLRDYKGNCVHMGFTDEDRVRCGVCDLDNGGCLVATMDEVRTLWSWPPPWWFNSSW